MSTYSKAFGNRSMNDIAQRGTGNRKNPWIQSRAAHSDILLIEASEKPLTAFMYDHVDPVYNIAIQNPTAQPGGGKCPMNSHRFDLADLYGIRSNQASEPVVRTYSANVKNDLDFGAYAVPAQAINNNYFAAGTRANGDAWALANTSHFADHSGINRKNAAARRERKYLKHDKALEMSARNSVVFTRTAFEAIPLYRTSHINIGSTYANATPPKTVVSSTDRTSFVSY
jgi:hypothetical protein